MKYLKLGTLLICICWSTLEITAQVKIDSVSIQKPQVKNIYVGLKQSVKYKEYYLECLQVSNELNQIIYDQDQELQKTLKRVTILNSDNEILNQKIIDSEKRILQLKNKKIQWYKHPILYGILGFVTGIYLMK